MKQNKKGFTPAPAECPACKHGDEYVKTQRANCSNTPGAVPWVRGFTLIEILIIVIIIGILVSVAMVSLMGARNKSQDVSAFTTFKSIAGPAYMCLMSGEDLKSDPAESPTVGGDLCENPTAANGAIWPDLDTKLGWGKIKWCLPTYDIDSAHPNTTCNYNNPSCGGDNSGNFCFVAQKGSKYMWCTLTGCHKEGF